VFVASSPTRVIHKDGHVKIPQVTKNGESRVSSGPRVEQGREG
jgi:hypothetical protein